MTLFNTRTPIASFFQKANKVVKKLFIFTIFTRTRKNEKHPRMGLQQKLRVRLAFSEIPISWKLFPTINLSFSRTRSGHQSCRIVTRVQWRTVSHPVVMTRVSEYFNIFRPVLQPWLFEPESVKRTHRKSIFPTKTEQSERHEMRMAVRARSCRRPLGRQVFISHREPVHHV